MLSLMSSCSHEIDQPIIAPPAALCDDQERTGFQQNGAPMDNEEIYDLTMMMERFIDEDMEQIDIMAELLTIAQEANLNSGYNRFRIGNGTYTLDELKEIQELEKQDVLFRQNQ
jgi:hypothetical protein